MIIIFKRTCENIFNFVIEKNNFLNKKKINKLNKS